MTWEEIGGSVSGGLAGVIVTIAAVLAALVLIWKSPLMRPVKWVWHRLVADPAGQWARGQMEDVVKNVLMQPNGGHSLADVAKQVQELRGDVTEIKDHLKEKP